MEDTDRREGSGHPGQVRDRDPDHRPLRYRDNEQSQGRRYRDNRNSDYRGGYSKNPRWRDGDSGQGWNRDQRYPPPGSRERGRVVIGSGMSMKTTQAMGTMGGRRTSVGTDISERTSDFIYQNFSVIMNIIVFHSCQDSWL